MRWCIRHYSLTFFAAIGDALASATFSFLGSCRERDEGRDGGREEGRDGWREEGRKGGMEGGHSEVDNV